MEELLAELTQLLMVIAIMQVGSRSLHVALHDTEFCLSTYCEHME